VEELEEENQWNCQVIDSFGKDRLEIRSRIVNIAEKINRFGEPGDDYIL
jgi:hypothetical protein